MKKYKRNDSIFPSQTECFKSFRAVVAKIGRRGEFDFWSYTETYWRGLCPNFSNSTFYFILIRECYVLCYAFDSLFKPRYCRFKLLIWNGVTF